MKHKKKRTQYQLRQELKRDLPRGVAKELKGIGQYAAKEAKSWFGL